MFKSKVLICNLLGFLTFVCARDLGGFQVGGNITYVVLKEADEQSDANLNNSEKPLLVDILTPNINSTGLQEQSAENKKECAGRLFDFIQCVVSRKIESFSLELGKLTMPNKPPEGFALRTMDTKIEGSLEDWLHKFTKHINSLEEDSTDD